MASPGFMSFDVKQDEAFRAGLLRAQREVKDLRPALRSIALDFYKSQKVIFNLKGPGRYPPFKKPSGSLKIQSESPYQKYKKKHFGFDYPLLKATGDLEDAVTSPNGRGSVFILEPQEVRIGFDAGIIPYGEYHQSDRPRKKIPLRKFLFIGAEGWTDNQLSGRLPRWLNILNTYVLRSMGVTSENSKGPRRG